jgi:hypothetical protein
MWLDKVVRVAETRLYWVATGREVREEMFEEVSTLLHDLDDGMRPISVLFPYLPTAPHRKRDA